MQHFIIPIQIRWSDLDPNFHLRHSVYYDWGALCRIDFFNKHELRSSLMQQMHFGPILFREECSFRKEIHFDDEVRIDLKLIKCRPDFSRWSIQHKIYKNGDIVSAIITIDGAWMDTNKRKLTMAPPQAVTVFEQMPRSEDFVWG